MVCPSCGTKVEGKKFCPQCGSLLSAPTTPVAVKKGEGPFVVIAVLVLIVALLGGHIAYKLMGETTPKKVANLAESSIIKIQAQFKVGMTIDEATKAFGPTTTLDNDAYTPEPGQYKMATWGDPTEITIYFRNDYAEYSEVIKNNKVVYSKDVLGEHHFDVNQPLILTKETANKLKVGMNVEETSKVLGPPTLRIPSGGSGKTSYWLWGKDADYFTARFEAGKLLSAQLFENNVQVWELESRSSTSKTTNKTTNNLTGNHYFNSRFGFSIDYPSSFGIPDASSTNRDGLKVYTADKSATITVYGSSILDRDVNYFYQQALSSHANVAYKAKEGNWYVVSWLDGGTIGYTKVFVGKGSMNGFEIQYPKAEQQVYGPIIDTLSASFKTPGIDNQVH